MFEVKCDVAIIGGGPAGLAAAMAAKETGASKVVILERDKAMGGILQQCIHPGFGITYFNEELTGTEYSSKFIEKDLILGIEFMPNTMVLDMNTDGTLTCSNKEKGMISVQAKSIVLAMGCRERTRAQIQIPGTRPAGVYTAGTAQRLINRQNEMVGKKIVILGSGDIGMIMARRLTLEGAKVVAVVEIMDFLAGLTRNRVQCLEDFSIPLYLSHTVTRIVGNHRVEGVYIAEVDERNLPKKETEVFVACDTLLLSVGLIPENELTKSAEIAINPITNGPEINQYQQTSAEPVFACGNVVHVNDLVDNVSLESIVAGTNAAKHALGLTEPRMGVVECIPGANVRYICPQRISLDSKRSDVNLFFRATKPQKNVVISAFIGDRKIYSKKAFKVNPGEMEKILVSPKDFSDGLQLTIHIKEDR